MDPAAKILLIGGSGRLGLALRRQLPGAGFEVLAPDRAELDIVRHADLDRRVAARRPAAVIHAAAFNDVDRAERPEAWGEVEALNVTGPARVAGACRRLDLPLIHLSTDYVFDGRAGRPYREDDPAHPLQAYGRSKLAGEHAVAAACPASRVVRTSTLYGPLPAAGTHYVARILEQLRRHGRVEVVRLPVASPTLTLDLADALASLLRRGDAGLYHVVNAGACSRLELAREIAARSGYDPDGVVERPAPSAGPARPRQCPLDGSKFERATGHVMRPWREALAAWLSEAKP